MLLMKGPVMHSIIVIENTEKSEIRILLKIFLQISRVKGYLWTEVTPGQLVTSGCIFAELGHILDMFKAIRLPILCQTAEKYPR